jgi:hypothetical protein
MRTFGALAKLLAVGVPVALIVGCDLSTAPQGQNSTSDGSSIDLESAYGGYSMVDERPAFGDPQFQQLTTLEDALRPSVTDGDTVPDDSTFAVRIIWGQLRGNRNAQTPVDWTGSVHINRGELALIRTLVFEDPRDHIVRPRPDAQTIEFVSHTLPHYDGLALLVHETPGEEPTTFSFSTAPFSGTWTLAELVRANRVIPVDDAGNAVAINAIPVHPHACPNGFARGAWVVRDSLPGAMRGVWLAPNGNTLGHLLGHFGRNAAGDNVWFAKIIGIEGRAIGLARGTWTPNADPNMPGGTFMGRFVTRRVGGGEIQGRYVPGRAGDGGAAGSFEARWRSDCEGAPADGEPPRDGGPGRQP